jgi:predicted transcriptional regulator
LFTILRGKGLGYRNKLDIIADMLHVTSNGAKKTQIMYRANLNYGLLTKRLDEVRKACLISFERKGRCYILTSKGKQFLELYKQYAMSAKHVEKHINDVNVKKKMLEDMCAGRSTRRNRDEVLTSVHQ